MVELQIISMNLENFQKLAQYNPQAKIFHLHVHKKHYYVAFASQNTVLLTSTAVPVSETFFKLPHTTVIPKHNTVVDAKSITFVDETGSLKEIIRKVGL